MRNQSPITRHQSQITNHQSPQNAIVLQNISKKYSLTKERPILLKNLFAPTKKEEIWALKNISLTIKKGECIGIIGENGSGKSTLLKIIAGITTSTKGKIEVTGRVGSLIELGAGFHPDLTGKENVYLNGMLLGFTKKELDKKYREIVEFADIGEYIDQPVRTYSSGMAIRLGFSVAIHLDPEILLIDEVLAVGDEEFQRKCLNKIRELIKAGKTIVFVSHNLNFISFLCIKAAFIHKGNLKIFTETEKAIHRYSKNIQSNVNTLQDKYFNPIKRVGTGEAKIVNMFMIAKNKKKKNVFYTGDYVKIRLFYECEKEIKKPNFGIAIYRNDGTYCYGINSQIDNVRPDKIMEKGYIDLDYPQITLLNGNYYFDLAIYGETEEIIYDYVFRVHPFKIISQHKNQGLVSMTHNWNLKK